MKFRNSRKSLKSCFLLSLFILPFNITALDLYGAAEVIQENEILTLSDIVSSYLGEEDIHANLHLSIPQLWEFPSIISSREIRSVIGKVLEQPFTFVGGALLFVPKQFSASGKSRFLIELLKFCNSQIDVQGMRIELERIHELPELLFTENVVFKFPLSSRSLGSGRNSILYKTSEIEHYSRLTVDVRFLNQAYVAARSISSNAILSDDLFTIDYRDTRKPKSELFDPAAILSSYYTIKDIGSGDILLRTDVERKFDVNAGNKVSVILERGLIQMTMAGYLLQSGNLGEMVQVRMYQTGKKIDGIIQSVEVVYVEIQ
jgi:flagella basal body P-ring formation protein FlgA